MKNKLTYARAANLDLRWLIVAAYDEYAKQLSVDEIAIEAFESYLQLRYTITYERENAEDLRIFVSRNIKSQYISRVVPEKLDCYRTTRHHLNTEVPFKDEIPHPRMETYDPNIVAGELYIHEDDTHIISALNYLECVPSFVKEIMIYDNKLMITPSKEGVDLNQISVDDWNTYLRPDWIEVINFHLCAKKEDKVNE